MKLLTRELAGLVHQAITAAQAAESLPAFDMPDIPITTPKRPEHGDYACPVAMQLAKPARLNPFKIATEIANHMPESDFVSAVEVAHPGFINIRLNDDWLRGQVDAIIAEGDRLFQLDTGTGKTAQVEFVSANPTGPLHVGRSRGAIVGDTIARLLEAASYAVTREYYFNNAGVQMTNLGNSLRLRYLEALGRPVEIPGDDDKNFYRGEYLIDIAKQLIAEQGDALVDADWQPFKEFAEKQMFEVIRTTLKRVQIEHDVFFNENSLYDDRSIWTVLAALENNGHIYRATKPETVAENGDEPADDDAPDPDEDTDGKDEATWFRSTTFGDQKDRVLVKSDSNPTYTLPDIAYHINKIDRGFDLLVNILGADHFVQAQVVRRGLQALERDPSKLHVVIIQLVRAVRDGKEIKMSTRRGDYDTLDDLIDMTSADAVRYLLLARSADSHLDFDIDLAVKESNDNPVYYIQNAYVRCAGIFREAAARGVSDEGADVSLLGDDELTFIRKALTLGEEIDMAVTGLEPHRIAFYALDLARIFHPVYERVRALHGDVPPELAAARLRFYRAAQVVFKRVLDLMGMTAPETM